MSTTDTFGVWEDEEKKSVKNRFPVFSPIFVHNYGVQGVGLEGGVPLPITDHFSLSKGTAL